MLNLKHLHKFWLNESNEHLRSGGYILFISEPSDFNDVAQDYIKIFMFIFVWKFLQERSTVEKSNLLPNKSGLIIALSEVLS
jgi:tRNA1(Val) A37 N6-methylase TrmN6